MSVSEQPERHSSLTKFSVLDFESCFAVKKIKGVQIVHFDRYIEPHYLATWLIRMGTAAKLTESVPDPYMKRFIKAGRDSQKINKKKLKIGTQTHYIFQQGNFNSNLMHK